MKKWIAAAVLLLVTGCAANDGNQANDPAAQGTGQPSGLSQASSISNTGAGTVSIHQAPSDGFGWFDWILRDRAPANNTAGQGGGGQGTGAATNPNTGITTNPNMGTPTDPNAQRTTADASQFAQQVLVLVNEARSKEGLNPLAMNSALSKMAMVKAQDMYDNNYFAHESPTYGSPFDMMKSFGIAYKWAGENIAKGQRSPEEVMNAWMNSPGHRANIVSGNFTQIGIAYYNTEWVQAFIG